MYQFIKVFLDFLISTFALFVFLPILLFIYLLIKLDSPSDQAIYRGKRTAQGGGDFTLYKFRTMIVNAELKGGPSTAIDDPRLTDIGRFLRRFKLDELPQFINVIKGDMSLVGPRPQVKYYTEKYNQEEKLILSVKPGITDIASIVFSDMDSILGSGNVDSKYEKEIEPLKNKLRIQYVQKMGFLTDISILIATFLILLRFNESKVKKFLTIFIPGIKI